MDKVRILLVATKRRNAFALVITLSVLAVIIALTMVLLSYFKSVQTDASKTEALIQANIYYADIIKIFNKMGKNKKGLLEVLYTYPVVLTSPDDRFSMLLRCKALSSGVNINWLGLGAKDINMTAAKEFAVETFERVTQEYNLEDPERLREVIIKEIGKKDNLVSKNNGRLRQKNGIISYKQFMAIVSRYQFEVDDEKASLVPWEKYFTFSSKAKVIDAKYSSAELLSFLFNDIDLQSFVAWKKMPIAGDLKTFVKNNAGDYAARKEIIIEKGFLEESECKVSFKKNEEQYSFSFNYIEGEAKYFEFYGKY